MNKKAGDPRINCRTTPVVQISSCSCCSASSLKVACSLLAFRLTLAGHPTPVVRVVFLSYPCDSCKASPRLVCRTVAVTGTQEAKKKKPSQPPIPFPSLCPSRHTFAGAREPHVLALHMQLKKKCNKAFENKIVVSSLQRDPTRSPPQGLHLVVRAFVVFS